MIRTISLQINPWQTLDELRELLSSTNTTSPSIIIPWMVAFIVMLGIGFLLWKGYQIYKNSREYAGPGRRRGKFRITIQGTKALIGNVNSYELPLSPEDKEVVKQIPYMKEASAYIEDLIKNKNMFVYQMRQTELSDMVSKKENKKDILLVSSAPLESERYSWEDTRGEFSIASARKEYPRNVVSYVTTRYHDITTPDQNIKEVYVLSPIPMIGENERMPFGFSEAEFLRKQHMIEVKVLKQSEALGKAVLFLEAVVLAEKKIQVKDKTIDQLQNINYEKDVKIAEKTIKEDKYRVIMNEKHTIGLPGTPPMIQHGEPWGWHIMFAISTISGYLIVPEMISTVPPFIGAVMGLSVMIGLRFISLRGQRRKDEQKAAIEVV